MAGAGVDRDGHRPLPRGVVAWPLALAAACRPRHRSRRLLPADGGRVRAGVDAARAEPHRGSATARSQFRPAASARPPRRHPEPGPAIADEIAAPTEDSYSVALWRAHIERALRAAKTLRAGTPMPRLALRDPFAVRALVAVLVVATFFAAGGERMKRIGAALDWQGVMMPAN